MTRALHPIILPILLASLGVPSIAAEKIPDYRAKLFTQAAAEAKTGHPEQARNTVRQLLKTDPSNVRALKMLAGLDDLLRDYESAFSNYQKALSKSSADWELELGMARASMQMGRFKQAIIILKKLAERHPDEPKIWLNLALAKVGTGENDEAEGAAEKAISLGGQTQSAMRVLAEIKLDTSQGAFAKELGHMLLASNAKDRDNYLFVLQCMAHTKSTPDELDNLVDLAETNLPKDADLFYQLGHRGIVHGMVVKPKDSQSTLQTRKRTWYLVAARALNLAALSAPQNVQYHMELARLLAELGMNHAAAHEVNVARQLDPTIKLTKKLERAIQVSDNDIAGRLKLMLNSNRK